MKESIHPDRFLNRHIGPSSTEVEDMLNFLGFNNLSDFSNSMIPSNIISSKKMNLPSAISESEVLIQLESIAANNLVNKNFLGHGYFGTKTPLVIKRNILENPGWYTQYTPYQAEIAQGRLEALLNFQTMVCDLTGMEIANASLLDEATAAAEAMSMACNLLKGKRSTFLVSDLVNIQTINVIKTRAEPLNIKVLVSPHSEFKYSDNVFGILLQYPAVDGSIGDHSDIISKSQEIGAMAIVSTDLLSLCLLKPPGEWGADIVIGNSQRFGVPMGFGGPHAAFIATLKKYKRNLPGRLVGVSKDRYGNDALRLALQTREQHIRRDRATSNICTAQVLLAIMSSMYAVYHGPNKLKKIAERVNYLASGLSLSLKSSGYQIKSDNFFDTIKVKIKDSNIVKKALASNINFWDYGDSVGISIDEETTNSDIIEILDLFDSEWVEPLDGSIPLSLQRITPYLQHPVFNTYHSETEMLRYIHRLETKDLSLNNSMIPLGSCTMKLNAVAEMEAVTWPNFSKIHPYAPLNQVKGYISLFEDLEKWLCEITGFAAISLQPNAGSQGEYAGMLAIREYHHSRGDIYRNICLIPTSAHGTNPASAVMVGMKVVGIQCDEQGNIDLDDVKIKAEKYSSELASMMITYPSTHGVFEETIREVCDIIHSNGGQVYMDGANMNAMVGLCKPGEIGADVCHLNLHKTFAIPHGGGGPGVGPIGVAGHLVEYLPNHTVINIRGEKAITAVSAAPWGSAGVLPISYAYMALLGKEGLKKATETAILNANYIKCRLETVYDILYVGTKGRCAHEMIVDFREFKQTIGLEVEDVAKRLMDYGFHAPTVSFPVVGTLMIEPTESESKGELDRFCDALIQIRAEIKEIEDGLADKVDNVLKNSPHSFKVITANEWNRPYSRETAAYPLPYVRDKKFWVSVSRIDNAYGDRNLICTCPSIEEYA